MAQNFAGKYRFFFDWLKMLPKARPFSQDILDYVDGPISFTDEDGNPIYIQVTATELAENQLGQELHFQFYVGDKPSGDNDKPRMGKFRDAHEMHVSLSPGDQYVHAPVFWYTLSSRLSLEENKRNLRDFVLSHYRQAAIPPKRGERKRSAQ